MRKDLFAVLVTVLLLAACATNAGPVPGSDAPVAEARWDPSRIDGMVAAARQARERGDLASAERLCYTAFLTVDHHAVESYDAYADLLKAEHRVEEPTVRAQAARLRESKAAQSTGTQPSSSYLGFAPPDGLNGYADLLQAVGQTAESQRMRSLALAYRQVQQAHFSRTMLYRQGKDPRGAC